MLSKLPGWITSNKDSVRRESERYISMTCDERWQIFKDICDLNDKLVLANSDSQRMIEAGRDPLGQEAKDTLKRLKRK